MSRITRKKGKLKDFLVTFDQTMKSLNVVYNQGRNDSCYAVSGDGSFSYIDELDNNDGVVAFLCTAAFIDDE